MIRTMRAIEITEPGGPNVLQMTSRPVPAPGYQDVLIQVAYASLKMFFVDPRLS